MRSLRDRLKEAEQAEADERPLQSRSDRRRLVASRESELKRLAEQLVGLRQKPLSRIPLGEELMAAVRTAQSIQSGAARNRQVLRIRQMLRDEDLEALEGALASRPKPSQPKGTPAVCTQWVDRLIQEGDAALDELMSCYPALDRQRLRTLARNAARKGAAADARRRLAQLLAPHLGPG